MNPNFSLVQKIMNIAAMCLFSLHNRKHRYFSLVQETITLEIQHLQLLTASAYSLLSLATKCELVRIRCFPLGELLSNGIGSYNYSFASAVAKCELVRNIFS